MEIIDLSSDSEDDVKLCSESKDIITHLCSEDRKENLDPIDGFDPSLFLLDTPFAQNNAQQPITLEDDDWLNSNHASCSYRSPAGSSHRIYPLSGSSMMLYDPSSYGNTKKENDDDDVYMYSAPPQSFPTSHPSLSDSNRVKEEDLTARFNYFGTSAGNGTGMFPSTMSEGWKVPFDNSHKVETDSDNDNVYAYEGPQSHRMFPPSMPSFNPVNGPELFNGFGTQSHPNAEKRPLGSDERAIYEEALQNISQETKEEDLPEGVLSISLLKHQRIALAWMLSKENSSHCPGGILADDQGLGKTISTIALIQKERVQQFNFMSADSNSKKSVPLDLDDDDDIVMAMDKKELKGEPSDRLDLEICASSSGTVVKVEPKKKTKVSLPSSASTSRSASRPSAGTLVVCPASILKQWASEIKAKVAESSKLSVLVYHGGSRTTKPTELAKYDVVVTTYTIVGQEVPKQDSDDDMEPNNDEKYGICPDFAAGKKRKLSKQTKNKAIKKKKLNSSDADLDGGPLARVRWFRVVLDEAQTIKNHRTKSARACCGLRAKRRWCLSGTPTQNTIDDLYSYFRFLKYEPYCSFSLFHSMIKGPISRGSSQGYKKLQTVLKIVLLRRTKETLLDGEPIIKVPPKTIELKKINFTQEERYFYLTLEEGSRQKFKKFAAAGTIKQNYANILVLLLRLRQACDHPYLLKDDNQANVTDLASIEMAKQLPKEIVTNLLEKLDVRRPICMICAEQRRKYMPSRTRAMLQTIKNHQTKSARACCGLRAKRRWCLSGTPMQNTIDDLYSYFRFLKYEPYCSFSLFRSMIKGPISRGSSQGYKKLQTVLKIVLLRRTKETLLDGEPIIKVPPKTIELKKINFTQEERYFYLTLEEGSRQKFKKFAAAGTIKQNYANILVLLLRLRQACDHPYLLKDDNQANVTDLASIEMAKQLPKEIVTNLLEKLDVRRPICMICAEQRRKYMPSRTRAMEPPENAVITTCCHIFCYECVLESLSEEEVCPVCKHKLSSELVFSRPVLRLCNSDELVSYATTSSAEPDELSSICETSYISSKIQAAVATLKSIFNTHAPTDGDTLESSPSETAPKAIVFSQWTGMLDVLELSLNSNFIKFRRLDGSMSLDVRGEAVEELKTDPEVRVMLMSLQAGNLGLNMIAASHVIMLDPWWNPYAEDQAVDRAHRIGQTRPVTVTRFTVNDTVEDRILALQAKKREMVESAFGDEKSGGISTRLTVEDLGYLFDI